MYIHTDLRGPGTGIGWVRATGVSLLGGLIRESEMTSIPHALAIALPEALLAPGFVWPAISGDAHGSGFVPEGSLLAIPRGTAKPGGLSPLGSAIFDALTNYGAYVVDKAGASVLVVEPTADAGAVNAARGDVGAIMPLVRRVVR